MEQTTVMKFALFFLLGLLFIGCDTSSKSRQLDELDSLIVAEKYDSAYQAVLKLNPQFDNDKDLAHYRLLLAETSYLTYNTLSNDSIIDAAIKYYEQSDEVEKLANAYYYKASCLHERNDDIQAIQFYKKAEEVSKKSKDLGLRYKIAESMVKINNLNGNSR